ncbi:MAG: hypothetical protein P4M11_02405 [Candidatus Pacebacteria bacterium]|nr:hypothetical protein [Candidatus Paceibacterota bacterium]
MVVICLVVEGVVMDSLYQVLHYALCLRNVPAEGAESRPEAKEGSLRRV